MWDKLPGQRGESIALNSLLAVLFNGVSTFVAQNGRTAREPDGAIARREAYAINSQSRLNAPSDCA